MAKYLQVSLVSNLDKDPEPEINVTPVDQKIPGNVADGFESAIMLADMADLNPGNNQLEVQTKINVPVMKLFGKEIKVALPVTVVLKVVEKP